ncbi:MAG: ABC transporter permease, partial [Syntrophales bacterium]|nr:ABC transporter permease [Syntrophales bacterium]
MRTEGGRRTSAISVAGDWEDSDTLVLSLAGELRLQNVRDFRCQVRALLPPAAVKVLTVDLKGLTHIDSAGALALLELEEAFRTTAVSFQWRGGNRAIRGIMDRIDREALKAPPLRRQEPEASVLVRIGQRALTVVNDFIAVMTFLGELLTALFQVARRPASVRWADVLFYMKKAGEEALPIVGLISVLIGLIMAFMSSLQLKQFGANIYVASLVGIAIVKELGPMMTAIIVAGRSGSAFAAEIGTMKVNEEVDALVTMGFEPVRFLAVPKVLASLFVVPLLTLYAMLFGIGGGLLVGILGLDLTFYTYLQQTMDSIDLFDIFTSIIKAAG